MFKLILPAVLVLTLLSCKDPSVPRPKGYFRIDLPKKEFKVFSAEENKPFSFEYPSYGKISSLNDANTDPGWLNLEFPRFHAKIYLTYKDVNKDLDDLMEQTYQMNVKNHIIKAEAINEQIIKNPVNKVYGVLYDLKGNTASAVQFYVTDSINHYLRGSLYFSAEPNADSLAPVIDFFREDIIHLIETLKWKEE